MGLGNHDPQRRRAAMLALGWSGLGWILLQYPRLIVGSSSWRPRHRTPAEYVRVRVVHRLPGIAAGIKDNAITGLGDTIGKRDLVSLSGQFRKQLRIRRRYVR